MQFAVKESARGVSEPTVGDLARMKRVCRYLLGKRDLVNHVTPMVMGECELVTDVDADWAADKVGRRSTSAGHMKLCGALLFVLCYVNYARTRRF